jgi:hypothetical protein
MDLPDLILEYVRQREEAIADFERRMREVVPIYEVGDRVEFYGDVFEVNRYERQSMPGYWLKRPGTQDLFLPVDLERELKLVVH